MNNFQDIISNERKYLTDKAPHTKYKIQYVSKYATAWTYVAAVSKDADNINFIDCMSNAGIYQDGDFCSAINVLITFREAAYKYPNKKFNIFFNDYNTDKVRILKTIYKRLYASYPPNLNIFIDNEDVNDYLDNVKKKYDVFGFPSRTILYVDPYSFHTVIINKIKNFIQNTYCELLFNLFTSDFNRNKNDEGIRKILGGDYSIDTIDDLVEHIVSRLLVGKMKYSLSYPFRQSKNVELYQILFLTPNEKGLEKLKDTLWKVFDGAEYFKTDLQKESGQISMFTSEDDCDNRATKYAEDIKGRMLNKFKGKILAYHTISSFILENSLLKASHVLEYVIKPLIAENKIKKLNFLGKKNYKDDSYQICE